MHEQTLLNWNLFEESWWKSVCWKWQTTQSSKESSGKKKTLKEQSTLIGATDQQTNKPTITNRHENSREVDLSKLEKKSCSIQKLIKSNYKIQKKKKLRWRLKGLIKSEWPCDVNPWRDRRTDVTLCMKELGMRWGIVILRILWEEDYPRMALNIVEGYVINENKPWCAQYAR